MRKLTKITVEVEYQHDCGAPYVERMTLTPESTVTLSLKGVTSFERGNSIEFGPAKPAIEVEGSIASAEVRGARLQGHAFVCTQCEKEIFPS